MLLDGWRSPVSTIKSLRAEQAGTQLTSCSAAISGAIKTSKLPEANAVDVTCKSQPRSYQQTPQLTSIQGELTTYCYGTGEPNAPRPRGSLLTWLYPSRAETFLVILCGSIPALKPIYDMCVRRHRASSRPLFSLPRKPTYIQKKIFPSLSTGDDSYIQLEPIQKNSARPTVLEVAPQANADVSQGRGGAHTAALSRFHRVPWERTASNESIGVHGTEPPRLPSPVANLSRGDVMV